MYRSHRRLLREATGPAAIIGLVVCALGGWMPGHAAEPVEWTVLAYLSGDSSLEAAALGYQQTLASVPPSRSVAIAVQIDRTPGYCSAAGDETGAIRAVLTGTPGQDEREALLSDWHREVNMGDPQTLCDFAAWGMAKFPAKRYLLLLMGHGTGVRELTEDQEAGPPASGVAYDATSGGDCLTVPEIGEACRRIAAATGSGRIDVLAVDACFSATAETAWEVAPAVSCFTGSPGLIYEPGVPWGTALTGLVRAPGIGAQELASSVVEALRQREEGGGDARGAYLAADLGGAAELSASLAALSGELRARMKDAAPCITLARSMAPATGLHSEMLGLSPFLRALAAEAGTSGWSQLAGLAARAAAAADRTILAEFARPCSPGGGDRQGWAVFFPPNLTAFPADYLQTGGFARDTGWGPLLADYLQHLTDLVSPAPLGA